MVGIVVVSHSAKLAEGVVELARQMGGDRVGIAAAGGVDDPDDPIGTDAFAIKAAIEQVWSPDGVLVLMDLGSAVMNAETALDFLEPPVEPDKVLLCEAPLVEGTVAAVATAGLGSSLEEVADEARAGLFPKVEHLGSTSAPGTEAALSEEALSLRVEVPNRLGLHLRPVGRLVEMLARFQAEVEVSNATTGAGPAPAGSLSRVSALGVRRGHVLEVRAAGPDAEAALRAVEQLAAEGFGDADEEAPAPVTSRRPPPVVTEGTIAGVGASLGVAVGPVRYLHRPELELPDRTPTSPDDENDRLTDAAVLVRQDIERQGELARRRAGEEEAGIFGVHRLILDDLLQVTRARIPKGVGAEQAWAESVREVADSLRALDEPYQAERGADVEAVGGQVLARLLDVDPHPRMEGPGVLVADDLTPGETAMLDADLVRAIVTSAGAPTSHSAILARGLGVPAVVAAGQLQVEEGTVLLVDGEAGTVVVDPDPDQVAAAETRAEADTARLETARREAAEPAVTRDGQTVEVAANIGSVEDARISVGAGADGVGLLRTEFLYLNRTDPPSEEEQETTYRSIAEALEGRPLVLRTLDVGGDKPLPFLSRPGEDNPFLGVRGLRLGLARPELLLAQLRAVLRVAVEHPIRLMFPMVSTLDEWQRARVLVAEAAESVGGLPASLQLGVMVEVPALALAAEHFAEVVDFFSVGTNDLTQYTLAAERGNPDLAGLADSLHPAVLQLIARTCAVAGAHGRWVGVCGELAGDPMAVPILLGLGVTELSMSPVAIPRVKQVVRKVDMGPARELAREVLGMAGSAQVRERAARHLAHLDRL